MNFFKKYFGRQKSKDLSEIANDYKIAKKNYDDAFKKREADNEKEIQAAAEVALQKMIAEVAEEKKLYGKKSQEQLLKERDEIMEDFRSKLSQIKKGNNTDNS